MNWASFFLFATQSIPLTSFCCLLAKVFHAKMNFFSFVKVSYAKIVPKFTKRESFCQKFRDFLGTRKFLPAKISALKVSHFRYPNYWH